MGVTKKELSTGSLISLGVILRGGLYSLILSVLLCAITGLVFHYTNITETIISWLAGAILFTSVLVGSAIAVGKAGSKALLHGLGIGIFFLIIVYAITTFLLPEGIGVSGSWSKFILILVAGILGGLLGVFNQT
ncbi:MAG TPA: TIGR04086 family membrane protein [Clostridia bacterium]|nr:TIGR04086 family membrane protein [Clostridia bacterium]